MNDDYARIVLQAGRDAGITPRGIVIGFATVFVESDWLNYTNAKVDGSLDLPHDAVGSDGMSVGLFQQQVIMGNGWWWGPVEVCQDPRKSADLFFSRLAKLDYNGGNSPGSYAQGQRTLCPRRRNGFSGRVTASGNVAVEKLAAPQLRNFWPVSQCDWPIDRGCLPSLPALSDPPTAEEQAAYDIALAQQYAAEDLAVSVLWALSGRQFGVCPVTTRPCPPQRNWDRYSDYWPPAAFYGLSELDRYLLVSGCGCAGSCSQGGPAMLHLPGPVQAVTKVTINGVVLAGTEYRLEGDVLYRLGGVWPSQDLGRPAGEDGTWTVEYLQGTPPPAGTAKLVGLLANEFLAACTGGNCRLPRNVTQVQRRGVSFDMFNPNDIYDSGKTGLAEIDMWLAAVNPNHLACAPEVL